MSQALIHDVDPTAIQGTSASNVSTLNGTAYLPRLAAMLAGLAVLLVPDHKVALQSLSVVACTYALYVVGTRGRSYLSPSGVFFLSSGVFVGLASHYLAQVGSVNDLGQLRDWAVVVFLVTVACDVVVVTLLIRWRTAWPHRRRSVEARPVPTSPVNFQVRALVLLGLSQVPMVKSAAGPIATASGLAGIMMLVLAASSRRVRMRWHGDLLLVALAVVAPLIWVKLEFQGGGRLTLAGLGIASLLAWNLVRPRRFQKVAVVLAIPAFLVFAGLNRSQHNHRDTDSKSVLSSGEGLDSMYGPLDTWTELVTADPAEQTRVGAASSGPRYGKTFLSTLLLPVPRSWWEHKPKGFGAELTTILRPTLLREKRIAANHSMAALSEGEWYVNFGYAGLVMMPLALGWFLAALDRAHVRLCEGGLADPDDWWRATILVAMVASLGDLFWVGTFTFFARGGLAAIIAWLVWQLSTRRPRRQANAT